MNDSGYKLYIATNKLNGYKYIGITRMSVKYRAYAHYYEAKCNYSGAFKDAIRKFGIKAFEFHEELRDLTPEQAITLEKEYIVKYRTYIKFDDCKGYNSSLGGEGVHTLNTEYDSIIQYGLDGNILHIFSSLRSAEDVTGVSRVSIANACDGKAVTAGGYQWRRLRDGPELKLDAKLSGRDAVIKAVNQYDLNGKYIRSFESVEDASKASGMKYSSTISKVCRGKLRQTHGYIWRYSNDVKPGIDIDVINKEPAGSRRVIQYNKNNEIVGIYESISEASRICNTTKQSISHAIKYKTCHLNSFWKTTDEYEHKRKVQQLTLDLIVVNEYESITEASRKSGIHRGSIYNCLLGKANMAGGYIWKYC